MDVLCHITTSTLLSSVLIITKARVHLQGQFISYPGTSLTQSGETAQMLVREHEAERNPVKTPLLLIVLE